MRKYLSTLAVVAALIIAAPAQAQTQFGIKAGLNVSKASIDSKVLDSSNRTGFFIGPMAEITLPIIGLGVDGAILYDQKGVELETSNELGEVELGKETLHYIDVPVNLKYSIGLGSTASIYLATGPQFSYNIGGKKLFHNTYSLKSSEFSWNVGAGAKVAGHLQIGYNYNIGLGDTAELNTFGIAKDAIKGNLKNNTHQISVAYLF